MALDPSKLQPGTIESIGNDGIALVGESATRLFQVRVIITALQLEQKGMRLSKGRSALAAAKALTGLRTNDRQKQIDALTAVCEQLIKNINRS